MKVVPSDKISETLSWIIEKIKQDKNPKIIEESRRHQIKQFESLKELLLDLQIEVSDQNITKIGDN